MADRVVENYTGEVPPMPEGLQRLLVEALDEGKKLLAEGQLVPFTMLVVGDTLFTEGAEGANPAQCFAAARHTVEGARGAMAYAFCYDGYIDTNEGAKDVVIAEGGMPGEPEGYAIGCLYTIGEDGKPKLSSNASYIGTCPNFMADLVDEPEQEETEMADEKKNDINTIEEGEKLELETAKDFDEPVKED